MIRAGAIFDPSCAYRYRLWRTWDEARPAVVFVLLNPSTADAETDDPTLRRCLRFARDWEFGRLDVVNLFALRATRPRALRLAADPAGPDNAAHMRCAVSSADGVVAAWGNGGAPGGRAESVVTSGLLPSRTICLGLTHLGQPRHPLYVPAACEPVLFVAG